MHVERENKGKTENIYKKNRSVGSTNERVTQVSTPTPILHGGRCHSKQQTRMETRIRRLEFAQGFINGKMHTRWCCPVWQTGPVFHHWFSRPFACNWARSQKDGRWWRHQNPVKRILFTLNCSSREKQKENWISLHTFHLLCPLPLWIQEVHTPDEPVPPESSWEAEKKERWD